MRFKKVKKGYKDKKTGLIWSKKTQNNITWGEAKALENKKWRLPTVRELLSIVDYEKHNPATKVKGTYSSCYWSASVDPSYPTNVWVIHFNHGHSYGSNVNNRRCVRLVRNN